MFFAEFKDQNIEFAVTVQQKLVPGVNSSGFEKATVVYVGRGIRTLSFLPTV